MKVYTVTYKKKCIYTDQPIGETLQEDVVAKNVDHLIYLCYAEGWYFLRCERIA